MRFITKKALAGVTALMIGTMAFAAGGETKQEVKNKDFSFEGIFGKFDQAQLQRGAQVYQEVCAACHGMKFLAFRNLGDEGGPHFTEDQVKAYALNFDVFDAELDDTRPAKPADKFPKSALENAPDLTLMAKARSGGHHFHDGIGFKKLVNGIGGPEYIYSLLTGYTGNTKEQAGTTLYENKAFPGGWIAMAPPLEAGQVEYADQHNNDLSHLSEDVAAFLMWTAEPKMMARKHWGVVFFVLLSLLGGLLYYTNKKIWRDVKYAQK